MYDLNFQTERERLAAKISEAVEAESITAFEEGPRWHLGASVIGDPCERKAWNAFRWLKQERFSGRMYRLFNRGHMEEPRFIDRLRGIGFEVFEFDGDGKQYKISGHKGHYGGSLDSVFVLPPQFGLSFPLLGEYKTHSEKSFTKLAGPVLKKTPEIVRDKAKAEGVRKSKPQHYAQMCAYGQAYGLKYGLYCAVNKNTDELYFEVVELDWNHAAVMYDKAGRVIFSQTPPPKISESPAFFDCKWCHFSPICHYASPVEKNCRSCEHAYPDEGGEWYCRINEAILPRETVPIGCPQYRAIV